MNNKGQIFSMIAVLMSALFILIFSGASHVPLDKNVEISKIDILSVDDFISNLDYFVDATIDKVTYDTLQFSVDYLPTIGNYTPYDDYFTSCFTKGYIIDGSVVSCSFVSGENISFTKQLRPILSNASAMYDIALSHTEPEVTFRQYDAYLVEVNVSLYFSLVKQNFSWSVPVTRSRIVDFSGLTDPATVNTPYERTIRYLPNEGDLWRTGNFNGNTTTIATFIHKGYYFRDFTGLSLVELLEGKLLTNTSEHHYLGINAFVPLENATGGALYRSNQTSMVLYHYTSGLTFTESDTLVRFKDVTGINSSLIFNKYYVLNNLRVTNTSLLLEVGDCCGPTSCDPTCGS